MVVVVVVMVVAAFNDAEWDAAGLSVGKRCEPALGVAGPQPRRGAHGPAFGLRAVSREKCGELLVCVVRVCACLVGDQEDVAGRARVAVALTF